MSFYEYWQEQEAKRRAEYQASVELARSWIGRRVWVYSLLGGVLGRLGKPTYGEVRLVDERGMVHITTGYTPDGQPRGPVVSANMLGQSVVLADG